MWLRSCTGAVPSPQGQRDLYPLLVYVPEKGTWECKFKAFSLNAKFLMKPEWASPGMICTKTRAIGVTAHEKGQRLINLA